DYAVWQRKWIEGEGLGEQAEYWKKTLAGAPEVLEKRGGRGPPGRRDWGRGGGGRAARGVDEGAEGTGAAARDDIIYDAAGGVGGVAGAADGTGGCSGGDAGGEPGASGDRGADRIFCKHAGGATGTGRPADGGRDAEAGEG